MNTAYRSISPIALICLICLVCLLTACGGETPAAASDAPETPAVSAVLPDAALREAASPTPAPAATREPDTAQRDAAAKYIDRRVTELYKEFGEPRDSSYAPSCLGPGQDGELYYDGFTVYTYKEGDSEVVTDVE